MSHHGLPDPPDKGAGFAFLFGGIILAVIVTIIGRGTGTGGMCLVFPFLISIGCIAYGLYALLLSWASF
jgi:hypothetical protein